MPYGILVSWPWTEPGPLVVKAQILTTGLPGNSLFVKSVIFCYNQPWLLLYGGVMWARFSIEVPNWVHVYRQLLWAEKPVPILGQGFGSSAAAESACSEGDPGSIHGPGRSPGEGIGYPLRYSWAPLVAQMIRIRLQCGRPGFNPWVGQIPWRGAWQPTPVFWPGESPWTEEPGRL